MNQLNDIWDKFCEQIESALPATAFGATASVLGVGFGALTIWAITHTMDFKLVIGAGSMSLAMFIYAYKW